MFHCKAAQWGTHCGYLPVYFGSKQITQCMPCMRYQAGIGRPHYPVPAIYVIQLGTKKEDKHER